jgi:hypothetical protein
MSQLEEAQLDREVRLTVYQHFVATGGAPEPGWLAGALSLTAPEVEASFRRLASQRVLVLQEDSYRIRMAMPFSGVPTAYRVETAHGAWWANCGWDALGIPAMLGEDARITTSCQDCDSPLQLTVDRGQPREPKAVLHFLVPAARWWQDIGFT